MILWTYRARIVRVVDGDTVVAECDCGFAVRNWVHLRVAGMNAPELFSGTNREAGKAARDFVVEWVADAYIDRGENNIEWPFEVRTYKDKVSFNRYVADIIRTDTGENLADALIMAGHTV